MAVLRCPVGRQTGVLEMSSGLVMDLTLAGGWLRHRSRKPGCRAVGGGGRYVLLLSSHLMMRT